MKKPELLLPAGNYVSLIRAIMSGADAVYIGVRGFNARAGAVNFDETSLSNAHSVCRLYDVRLYIALNIYLRESKIKEVRSIITTIANLQVDGIIISDIGLIPLLNEIAPTLPIHISTQSGIHNKESAAFFAKLGADRVILARETTQEDIVDIKKTFPKLNLEAFVHGALCVSFSGGCLLSYVQNGGSGNVGACLQPCRQKITLTLGDTSVKRGYCLSTSDLCMISKLPELSKLGIDTFKIEGRMRRPEYVAQTALSYSSVLNSTSTSTKELTYLKRIYNRGNFCSGYMFSDTLDIMSTNIQGHLGEKFGKVLKVFLKGGYNYAEVTSKHPITQGDGFKILRGLVEVGGSDVHSVEKISDNVYIIPVSNNVCANDIIYLTTDKAQNDILNSQFKKIPVGIGVTAIKGQPLSVYVQSGKISSSVESDFIVQPATTSPVSKEIIKEVMSSLGDTEFYSTDILIDNDKDAFFPISKLNALRRDGIASLRKVMIAGRKPARRTNKGQTKKSDYTKNTFNTTIVECGTFEDLTKEDFLATRIVFRPENFTPAVVDKFLATLAKFTLSPVYLAIPRLLRLADKKLYLDYFSTKPKIGIYADNYGAVELARSLKLPYIAGLGLNIFNTNTMDILSDADNIIVSPELADEDLLQLLKRGGIPFTSGHLPLMLLAHCPVYLVTGKNCARCTFDGSEQIKYTDAKYSYTAIRYKASNCQFVIYNPIYTNKFRAFELTNTTHGYFHSRISLRRGPQPIFKSKSEKS
ncbi:MAG: U32 family peptidase [Christensenellaceae bacterium]|jgi:putative protease|nr:U32 family peptidase [Christensenellaceae bacterium]